MSKLRYHIVFIIIVVLCLQACTTTRMRFNNGLIARLNNRGPVALSPDNPFLAANLLISKEMENSSDLEGFIQHRGAPAAIEVHKETFSPLFLSFYYPENRQQYDLEQAENTWMIRGPNKIELTKFKEIAGLTRNIQGQPILDYPTNPLDSEQLRQPVKRKNTYNTNSTRQTKESQQLPGNYKQDSKVRSHHNRSFRSPKPQSELSVGQEWDFNSIIKTTSRQPAELTPRGDLVHYVTYQGETLSMIARWYTLDRANAGRLARINRLSAPDKLLIGDVIIIPSYLIKNKNRLTERAVKALESFIEKRMEP